MSLAYSMYPSPLYQIDICFYESLKDLRNNNKFLRFFFVFRLCLVIYHIIDHWQQQVKAQQQGIYNKVMILYILMGISNIATFIYSNWSYYKFLSNSKMIYQIAQKIDHSQIINVQQNIQNHRLYNQIPQIPQLKISINIYEFATNLQLHDVDDQYKRRAQRNCRSLIIQNMELNNLFRFYNQLFNVISLGLFVYSIVILCLGSDIMNVNDYSFIISYLLSQVITRLLVYLIMLIIGLSPIFCLIFCIYSCFCAKNQKIQLPPTKQATLDIIRECQGDCPICYQNIKQKQQVIILRCSPKHVFHDLCIKGWTKIGKTCPICRLPI